MERNSTIRPKIGKCDDCPITEPARPLIAGRCQYHYQKHRASVNQAKKLSRDNTTPVRSFARQAPEIDEKPKYGEWFVSQRAKMTGKCCNCQKATSKFSDQYFTWSIAHVLPKQFFPSVAKHPDGWIELCGLCHTKYDHSWMTAVKMPVFGLALMKFKIIEPDIAPDERRRIPECFLKS